MSKGKFNESSIFKWRIKWKAFIDRNNLDDSLDAKAGKIIIITLIIIMIVDNQRNSKSTYRKHLLLALTGNANTWGSNNPWFEKNL